MADEFTAPIGPPARVRMTPRDVLRTIVRARYGWQLVDDMIFVQPLRDALLVKYRDEHCHHVQVIEVGADVLYAHPTPHETAAVVIEHLERHRHERRCYCVLRQEAA